ncbi:MAG TPA: hypothetical protein DEQ98_09620 [Acidobacteria bacterium]|nr:hypothetical protein [Acidobacteriota bacterium]HCE03488.1 hypothetical protein [Acidobacteriota bacterium]
MHPLGLGHPAGQRRRHDDELGTREPAGPAVALLLSPSFGRSRCATPTSVVLTTIDDDVQRQVAEPFLQAMEPVEVAPTHHE